VIKQTEGGAAIVRGGGRTALPLEEGVATTLVGVLAAAAAGVCSGSRGGCVAMARTSKNLNRRRSNSSRREATRKSQSDSHAAGEQKSMERWTR
jgi:hypothetical protein